jgi:sulfite exporter TauE/SafE
MQGFLLGLANGTSCLAFCAPVLIPFFLSAGSGVRQSSSLLTRFLAGRLLGYLLFGLLAWSLSGPLLAVGGMQSWLLGITYIGLSGFLLVSVFRKNQPAPDACSLPKARDRLRRWPRLLSGFLPVGIGFLVGMKICPPLLLAFTDAVRSGSLGGSLLLFFTFFLGTSIFFLPFPLLGTLSRIPNVCLVGKFAGAIVALYYLISGILLFAGGIPL